MEGEQCANCQHSVSVRGMQQIVCLAHLTVCDPGSDRWCREFECKRGKLAAGAGAGD